ncbi:MAG: flagellar brake protein [Agarilytica sp.]
MLDLSDQELISALLDAQQQHKVVKVYLTNGSQALNSNLLGFDYYERSLLLDSLTPPVGNQQLKSMAKTPFWLQVRHQDSYLNLYCVVSEFQYDLYTLKILQHEFTDNQRWFPRIRFDARQGPELTLDVPHELPIKGRIRNLSVHGAMVEFYGEDIREHIGSLQHCLCRLRFNELFDVELKADVKQLTYERKPSCHSRLRLMFTSHSGVSYSQLDNFIDAFNEAPNSFAFTNKSLFRQMQFA